MKLLITGCRGFIGESVGRFAAHAGHYVLGIARSSQPAFAWPGKYIQADVLHTDLSETIRLFAPDIVLHAAGTASVGASLTQPLDDLRAAVLTWANLLESIRRSGINPVVLFPSSAAVYGSPEVLPISEDAPLDPVSPYGFHKQACELLAREYAQCFGLTVIVCRLFSVIGPLQHRLLVWELFQQLTTSEETVWLQGTGKETRDYVHVDDIAAGMLEIVMNRCVGGSHPYSIVNIASGLETPILDIAKIMRDLIAPNKVICCRGKERPGDPARWCADTSRLLTLLPDWKPRLINAAMEACLTNWHSSLGQME